MDMLHIYSCMYACMSLISCPGKTEKAPVYVLHTVYGTPQQRHIMQKKKIGTRQRRRGWAFQCRAEWVAAWARRLVWGRGGGSGRRKGRREGRRRDVCVHVKTLPLSRALSLSHTHTPTHTHNMCVAPGEGQRAARQREEVVRV